MVTHILKPYSNHTCTCTYSTLSTQGAVEWLAKVDVDVHNYEHHNVPRFLNRILGIPSEWQSKLFNIFSSTLDNMIRQAKLEKSYDQGIVFCVVYSCF